MGSYTLIVGVLKYILIFGGFVRFDSDPFGLSYYFAFVQFCFSLSSHVIAWRECWLSTPVPIDHGIVHLGCWSIKIFSHFWGVLSTLILILLGFRPMVLLSIFAFLCPQTWSHDKNVDYLQLYQVIMGLYTLVVGVLKYFLIFGGFVRFDSDPLGHSSYGTFVHFCFSLSTDLIAWLECFSLSSHVIAWWECWLSTPVSCDHFIVHLNCWSIKTFSHFWGFCPLWFWSFFGFRNVVLFSIFPFLCPPMWSHDENVDYPHLYHVIMGSFTLIVGVLKYFLIFGGFVRFDSDPILAFVMWCFCPFLLFSGRPRDRMTRMLIIHNYIMWSWDRAPWLLKN